MAAWFEGFLDKPFGAPELFGAPESSESEQAAE